MQQSLSHFYPRISPKRMTKMFTKILNEKHSMKLEWMSLIFYFKICDENCLYLYYAANQNLDAMLLNDFLKPREDSRAPKMT